MTIIPHLHSSSVSNLLDRIGCGKPSLGFSTDFPWWGQDFWLEPEVWLSVGSSQSSSRLHPIWVLPTWCLPLGSPPTWTSHPAPSLTFTLNGLCVCRNTLSPPTWFHLDLFSGESTSWGGERSGWPYHTFFRCEQRKGPQILEVIFFGGNSTSERILS